MNSTEWAKHLYIAFRGWGRYSTYGMCSMHSMDILKMGHYPANVFFIPQMQYFNLCVTSFVNILRWVGWVWYVFLSTRRDLNPAPVGEESIALSTELKDNPKLWQ